jgi:hypothetical protein
MTVSIIRQYNKQNGNQVVDTTGGIGYGTAVVACHSAYNADVAQDTFNGSGPTGTQTYVTVHSNGGTRTRNRISWWLTPPIGSYTWTMNDTYEGTIFVLDGVMSAYSYGHGCASYEGQGVVHQQSDSVSNLLGISIGCVTDGNGRSNTEGVTEDYNISWNSPGQAHWHKACTSAGSQTGYTISSDNRQGGWGCVWLRPKSMGGVIMMIKKWKERVKLLEYLRQGGAVDLGKRQTLLPI